LDGLGEGIWGQLISILLFFIFIFFYQRIMVTQIIFKLEKSAELLEAMSTKAEITVLKKISKKSDKKLKNSVKNFLEFFVISPVDIDPYGIIKKLEHLINLEKDRFNYFVNQIAPKFDSETKANLTMGLSAAMSLYQLAKVLRHFVELIKKTKSINLAMVLQMQLPLVERLAKALLRGTEALTNGWPIGDTIGAYVAADLIGDSKVVEADDETVVARKKYKNRDLIIIKAKGPGGRTGNPGKVLDDVCKKEKVVKIITIDAALKLEGEKTGSIAEGVGVAIGGIGVDKSYVEEVAIKKKLPLDTIIIKMGQEEAIMPMKRTIFDSLPKVMNALNETIERTTEKGKIIIIGVGNTSGIGNDRKDIEKTNKLIKENIMKMKALEKKRRKRFSFFSEWS
jgi:hypothetical protein